MRKSPQTYMDAIKQLLIETNKAYTTKQLAEELNLRKSNIFNSTELMMAFNVLERRKASGRYYYFLKDTYSEKEIFEMLPKPKPKPAPRPRRTRTKLVPGKPGRPRRKTESELFMEDYLGDLDERASSTTDGLRGLAILGLPDIDSVRQTKDPIRYQTSDAVPDTGIKMFATLTVKQLPKNMRRLPKTELNYLKNFFKQFGWFPFIENLHTGYAKFTAIRSGRYGDTFHFSRGGNPWDEVISIKVGASISNDLFLPTNEIRRWEKWNEFNNPPREVRPHSGVYGEMLNEFIESGHKLVEITSQNRPSTSLRNGLKYQIERRELQDQIEVSRVHEYVYLEKLT